MPRKYCPAAVPYQAPRPSAPQWVYGPGLCPRMEAKPSDTADVPSMLDRKAAASCNVYPDKASTLDRCC